MQPYVNAYVSCYAQHAYMLTCQGFVSAGKTEKITITNDKGRLSQEEIERMVQEAEEYAEQDKQVKARIDARNKLETYCYNMKNTIEDKLGDKLEEDDKEKVSKPLFAKLFQEWNKASCIMLNGMAHATDSSG